MLLCKSSEGATEIPFSILWGSRVVFLNIISLSINWCSENTFNRRKKIFKMSMKLKCSGLIACIEALLYTRFTGSKVLVPAHHYMVAVYAFVLPLRFT